MSHYGHAQLASLICTTRWMNPPGEGWASRVGRRYGWWGYEKGAPAQSVDAKELHRHLAGDVANAVVAYAVSDSTGVGFCTTDSDQS